jgi:tetratricopeptide (TPR) repeat protein
VVAAKIQSLLRIGIFCGLAPETLNPSDIGALVALVNQDRLIEAEHKARALLTMHPNAGMLWTILGVALLRQDKDALQALRRTTALMPDVAEAHSNLGAALHDKERWAEALMTLHQALAIQPHNVEVLVDAVYFRNFIEMGPHANDLDWTRRMLDFFGLPWDPKCLDFRQTKRVVITASKWRVRQKINAESVGRWRNSSGGEET